MKVHLFVQSPIGTFHLQALELARQTGAESIRAYPNLGQAVAEVIYGLLGNFPIRRNVGIWKHSCPIVDEVKSTFLKEGWSWQEYFEKPGLDFETWCLGLKSDSLFFMGAEDDPATGRLFEVEGALDKLGDKKIFQLRVSYSRFLKDFRSFKANPFSIRICVLPSGAAVAVFGQRVKVPSLVFGYETSIGDWREKVFSEFMDCLKGGLPEFQKQILDFESKLPVGVSAFFQPGSSRLWDRSVLCFEEGDGSALLDLVLERRGLKWNPPGHDQYWESLSLCRWNLVDGMAWLKKAGLSPEKIRGLMIIDGSLAGDDLFKDLSWARSEVERLQTGKA